MKKFFISLIIFISIIFSVLGINSLKVCAVTDPYNERTGLGYTINSVTNRYLDVTEIRDGSPIFNETWLSSYLANIQPNIVNSSEFYSLSGSTFSDITSKMYSKLGINSSIGGSYDLFTANAQFGYEVSSSMDYSSKASQYFYTINSSIIRHTYAMPNYSSDLSVYRANLHTNYLNALDDLFNNRITPKLFFDCYGTHLIAKGIYGGKLELYYSAASNSFDVGESLSETITSALDSGIRDKLGTSQNISFSLSSVIGHSLGSTSELFNGKAFGGVFEGISLNSLDSGYTNWTRSVVDDPALIGTSSDGLIPLWNLLPTRYNTTSYKDQMIQMFNNYALEYKTQISNDYDPINVSFPNVYNFDAKLVRSSTYRIDDSGRFNHNKYDSINLDSFTKYGYSLLKAKGYNYIDVNITMSMREINDGYQYVGLYSSTIKSDDYKIMPDIEYDYGYGDTFKSVNFSFKSVPIESFNNHLLVIRYGASGWWADDWENKNVKVNLIYRKTI